jgi:hypothetical protein
LKLRYKAHPEEVRTGHFQLNTCALNEVLTGDDSAYFHDLEVFIEARQEWKCLRQAFKDKDVITDNYNTWFAEPTAEEDRERGYFL